MTEQITVSEYLFRRLIERGVNHLFAVPGDYIGDFLDELDKATGIERIGTVNELEAGFAADGYARSAGLSCMALQYGVGTYSALNAVAGAARERVPMVMVTGAPSMALREKWENYGIVFHHSTSEDMDVDQKVFAQVCAATEVIRTSEGAGAAIDRAIATAIEQNAPTYIQIWKDVQLAKIDAPTSDLEIAGPPASWPDALQSALDETVALLRAAKSPVFWAGLELQRMRLNDELAQLISSSQVPFTTTIQAKGVVANDHPLYMGTFSGAASDDMVIKLMDEADLVIELGAIPIDYYHAYVIEKYDHTISVQADYVRIGSAKYEGVQFRDFLLGLIKRIEDDPSLQRPPQELPRLLRHVPEDKDMLTFEAIFNEVNSRLDDQTGVFCDLGISMFMGSRLDIQRVDGFTCQSDWMSLGYAAPAALGFALHDGRPLYAIAGDGSFQMTAQTLSTYANLARARNYDPSFRITIIVIDNGIYGLEQCFTGLPAFLPKKPPATGYQGAFDAYNVLTRWDYALLARSLGLEAETARDVSTFKAALTKAEHSDRPTLIQAVVGEHDLPPEMIKLVESFKPKK